MSLIKIIKNPDFDYCFSVDGNKYGKPYDSTYSYGFSDEKLVSDDWEEVLAVNGSLFYYFENGCYACGLEKSRGTNNQETEMTAVTDYDNCMAIACMKETGQLIFGQSKWIRENVLNVCYGAITGIGILLGGKLRTDLHKGFETQWKTKAKRNLIGEDKDGNIYSYVSPDLITCAELINRAIQMGFHNAMCLDGGGSIFRRVDGKYTDDTTRKVKNCLLLYRKEKKKEDWEEKYHNLENEFSDFKTNVKTFIKSCQKSTNETLDKFIKDMEE